MISNKQDNETLRKKTIARKRANDLAGKCHEELKAKLEECVLRLTDEYAQRFLEGFDQEDADTFKIECLHMVLEGSAGAGILALGQRTEELKDQSREMILKHISSVTKNVSKEYRRKFKNGHRETGPESFYEQCVQTLITTIMKREAPKNEQDERDAAYSNFMKGFEEGDHAIKLAGMDRWNRMIRMRATGEWDSDEDEI
ncbi:hypothetical protein ABW20_dc0104224 [Dactylellina cionopaga]|nr:hypothetical protein ABW20_dc0104224 [Dactylellina cionopaga]